MGKPEKKVLISHLDQDCDSRVVELKIIKDESNIAYYITGSKGRRRQFYYSKHGTPQVANRIARVSVSTKKSYLCKILLLIINVVYLHQLFVYLVFI